MNKCSNLIANALLTTNTSNFKTMEQLFACSITVVFILLFCCFYFIFYEMD